MSNDTMTLAQLKDLIRSTGQVTHAGAWEIAELVFPHIAKQRECEPLGYISKGDGLRVASQEGIGVISPYRDKTFTDPVYEHPAPSVEVTDAHAIAQDVFAALDKQACPGHWLTKAYEAVVAALGKGDK